MSTNLDLKYIADLFEQARCGDSNAFAEFYAATCQKEYVFACAFLKDAYLAEEALRNTYLAALTDISKVHNSDLILAWLTGINLKCCFEIHLRRERYKQAVSGDAGEDPESAEITIDGHAYTMRQVLALPFTEAQVIVLQYVCGMKRREIASLTEIRPGEVRRYIESGLKRLKGPSGRQV